MVIFKGEIDFSVEPLALITNVGVTQSSWNKLKDLSELLVVPCECQLVIGFDFKLIKMYF